MARTIKNAKLDTRSGRAALAMRAEPHWTVISKGCAIGYRKGGKGGTWVARMRDDDGRQHYEAMGAADDARDADGLTVFTFAQAQERARVFFKNKARELAGDTAPDDELFTVARALEIYFTERARKGSKGLSKDIASARVRILPALGEIEISKLTTKTIRDWQSALALSPKMARTGKDGASKTQKIVASDADAIRARKASANRVLTILKAALNSAYQDGRAMSDDPWRRVKPFRGADAPVIRYLSQDETRRLVNACDGAFREIVRGALLTGCRYGELTRMVASDFNPDARTVTVRQSKAGKVRHVFLTAEGVTLFERLTTGKNGRDLIFTRDDGALWAASHQQRPLITASIRAHISPAVSFHVLRHTHASALAMAGAPMSVIGAQLGHAPGSPITARHYAHLAPNYVADAVRAALPNFGIVENSNIATLRRA